MAEVNALALPHQAADEPRNSISNIVKFVKIKERLQCYCLCKQMWA